jgi:hypothetical protein
MEYRQTRLSDVCGTIDELKRLLEEERDKVFKSPENYVEPLLDDALYMLFRMNKRLKEYRNFVEEVRECIKLMEKVEEADLEGAKESTDFIRSYVKSIKGPEGAEFKKLDNMAEAIRSVANDQEGRLRKCKELALKIYASFMKVKGNRGWLLEEGENLKENLEKKYQAWLPPEPHKEKILEFLVKSRAYVIEASRLGEEPRVQFEDGGLILMSKVRWDLDIENFYLAGFKPSPSGRKYRP